MPSIHARRAVLTIASGFLVFSAYSCGSAPSAAPPGQPAGGASAAASTGGVLLDTAGRLETGDLQVGAGFADHYEVVVAMGDRVSVDVTSSEFDPLLEVGPPGAEPLVNDDFQGDRQRSRIELVATSAGTLKVRVTSYSPGAVGGYRVRVERTPLPAPSTVAAAAQAVAVLNVGQLMGGELAPGDATLSDGAFYDQLAIAVAPGAPVQLRVAATDGPPPRVEVLAPTGGALAAGEGGIFSLSQPGMHRAIVAGTAPGQRVRYSAELRGSGASTPRLARDHHQLPTAAATARVQIGQRLEGELAPNDPTLPSGETADVYGLSAQAGTTLSLEMSSNDVDSYLLLVGPDGRYWENDDAGGSRGSILSIQLPTAGDYRIVATTYRAGERGRYELKILGDPRGEAQAIAASGARVQPSGGGAERRNGSLAQGDEQLRSGELYDRYTFDWRSGQRVTLRASSTQFDTYLIVRTPSGRQEDNDDVQSGNTNSQIELQVTESGQHVVMVTSYRPGEAGAYVLEIDGGGGGSSAIATTQPAQPAQPATASGTLRMGQELRGRLAQGDSQLSSGEFFDSHTVSFEPGRAVRLRLRSSDFDTYLIARTPSGQQIDNDDVAPGDTSSSIDIPRTEAGTYTLLVTSYQPGESGAWTLRAEEGSGVPAATPIVNAPPNAPPVAAPPGGRGGRIYGVFAGITDYPAGVGDLPECANDAVKLAQTLRERGLLTEDRQIVLTDAQATRDNIRRAMRDMARRIGPDDVFVFFYSGHGGRAEGRPTRDTREIDGADEYLVMHDGELLDDELGTLFDGVRARMAVLALDACFAGGFAKDVITRPGRVGLFSSEEDVTSAVAGAFQAGGYLSHFLRMGVGGDADMEPRDSVLTVGELTHYLTVQFGSHVRDVRMSEGYQHLVVDRGAVRATDVMWAYR